MSIHGRFIDGVIVPDDPSRFEDGMIVELILPAGSSRDDQGRPFDPAAEGSEGLKASDPVPDDFMLRMLDLVVDTGISDLARNHDHYLYGHPKVDHDQ